MIKELAHMTDRILALEAENALLRRKEKRKRVRRPKADVLAWLAATHPRLHATAEVDRDWVWITESLNGTEHDGVRKSIKDYGFVFAKRGGHPLPSGRLGTWGNSCLRPLPFKRRKGAGSKPGGTARPEPEADTEVTLDEQDQEALAFLGV